MLQGRIIGNPGALELVLGVGRWSLAPQQPTLAAPDVISYEVGGSPQVDLAIAVDRLPPPNIPVQLTSVAINHLYWVAIAGPWWKEIWQHTNQLPNSTEVQVHSVDNDVTLSCAGQTLETNSELAELLPYFFPTHPSPLPAIVPDTTNPRWLLLGLSANTGLWIPDPDCPPNDMFDFLFEYIGSRRS